MTTRPNLTVHLSKMQNFQAQDGDWLDSFFDNVEELANFYHWDEWEPCCQARVIPTIELGRVKTFVTQGLPTQGPDVHL